jgi:hypothetical protein
MHMIGIYKIDLHVNAVFLGVLGEVAGYAGRSGFVQQFVAIQCSPDQVNPAARVRMHRHADPIVSRFHTFSFVEQEAGAYFCDGFDEPRRG